MVYDTPTDKELLSVEYLLDVREKLGHPETIDTPAGWKLLDACLQVWVANDPQGVIDFKESIRIELDHERTIRQHIDGGGHTKLQYPRPLYNMLKYIFPKHKLHNNDKFTKEFLTRYPKFSGTKYKQF